jgi:hypothetical protein
MRTLRFVLVARAGRLTRIGGRHVLRLAQNPLDGGPRVVHPLTWNVVPSLPAAVPPA